MTSTTSYDDYVAETNAAREAAKAALRQGVRFDHLTATQHAAQALPMSERLFKARAINSASNAFDLLETFRQHVTEPLAGVAVTERGTSADLAHLDAVYAAALAALDRVVKPLRANIEQARRLTADLVADRAEEERRAAEEAAAAARRERLDAEVGRRVAALEQERLAAVEADVREQLMAGTS